MHRPAMTCRARHIDSKVAAAKLYIFRTPR
jgi:hypothetical protein